MRCIKAAFLDRDGVINYDYGYVHKLEDFNFCEGIFEGLKTLIELNFILIIITNQSGIARGIFSEKEYETITDINDIPELLLKKIKHFFEHYKDLDPHKWVKVESFQGVKEAKSEILSSISNYQK